MGKNPFQPVAREKVGVVKKKGGGGGGGGVVGGVGGGVGGSGGGRGMSKKKSASTRSVLGGSGVRAVSSSARSVPGVSSTSSRAPSISKSAAALAPFLAAGITPPAAGNDAPESLSPYFSPKPTRGGGGGGGGEGGGGRGGGVAHHQHHQRPRHLVGAHQRVVFVGPLSPGTDHEALHARFKHRAPFQVRFLERWDTGERTGVAALEFTDANGAGHAAETVAASSSSSSPEFDRGDGLRAEASIADVDAAAASLSERGVAAMLRDAAAQLSHDQLATPPQQQQQQQRQQMSKPKNPNAAVVLAAADLDRHTVELLSCMPHAAAQAAVREYYKAAAASFGAAAASAAASPKSPATTLRNILRRRRAADGTPTYAGFFRGLPLPRTAAERLERLLETINWKEMGNVRAASIKVDNSFSLGMATKSLQKTGPFATPFAFKHGMGVWDGLSVLKKHKEVWDASMALLREIDPAYHCTSIGFNKNFKGSPHRDEKDSGCQIATAFGAFRGGALRVYGSEGIVDVDTNRRWCRFDGRYVHEVLPFKGTRYSVIFYQLEPAFAVDRTSTEEGGVGGGGGGGEPFPGGARKKYKKIMTKK